MKDETVKSSINTVLMYLAGNIHASALCFKKRIEKELAESCTSIKDALPKLAIRTLFGVLALVLVLNADTIVNFMIEFNHWLLYEFK